MNDVSQRDFLDRRQLVSALRSFRRGDFSVRLPEDLSGTDGEIARLFNEVVMLEEQMTGEFERLSVVVGKDPRLVFAVASADAADALALAGAFSEAADTFAVSDWLDSATLPEPEPDDFFTRAAAKIASMDSAPGSAPAASGAAASGAAWAEGFAAGAGAAVPDLPAA